MYKYQMIKSMASPKNLLYTPALNWSRGLFLDANIRNDLIQWILSDQK